MTRYAVQCADGRQLLPEYPSAESAAEVVAAIDRIDAAGCGPHTVVELPEPCCPDNPAARCVACRDGNPEHCTAPTYVDTVERWGKTL